MAKRLSSIVTGTPTTPPVELPASPVDGRGRLRKPFANSSHTRSVSAQHRTSTEPSLHDLRSDYAHGFSPGDLGPLPPPPVLVAGMHSRSSSMDRSSRPGTPGSYSRPGTPSLQVPRVSSRPTSPVDSKRDKKRGWFGKDKKDEDEERGPMAWIAGHPQHTPYDVDGLVNARPMQELWDKTEGNCYIYLFPRDSGKGPSFKVDSAVFASSPVLTRLAFGDLYSQETARRQAPLDAPMLTLNLNDHSSPPTTPRLHHVQPDSNSSASHDSRGRYSNFSEAPETHLYLPIKLNGSALSAMTATPPKAKHDRDARDPATDDLQTLIDIRNFFAFLCGQSLVATERRRSFFNIFMNISGILKTYEFTNLDGSTFGEVASTSFDSYVEELGLADVRTSREQTIESLVLGERMKSVLLYNEAFTHAVGKHEELLAMKSPKYNAISPITQNRLIRAAMDLEKRTASVRLTLESFEFQALFTGIMASKTSEERKEGVRFDAWKEAFFGMRKNLLAMLKNKYGDWPPKAKSKKNDLETSGLNRLVLKDLYYDMCCLYDLLVDRNHLTTRTVDGINLAGDREEATIRAIRSVLSEYDRSSPPVKPPVPFDLPKLPNLKSTRPDFGTGDKKKDIKAIQKKLKDDEIAQILRASWNNDVPVTPFIEAFRDVERRAAHGCTIADLVDIRIGQWIFMYVVLQALPMLACDAPSLKWTQGVEYFLCEPPRSGVPWANANAGGSGAASAARRTWFSVGDGGGVVSLPSDVVEHGVEGIYRRSHCWVMAEKWSATNPILNSALHEQEAMNTAIAIGQDDPLPSPLLLGPNSRSSSPAAHPRSNRNSTLAGLEALPLPAGVTPDGHPASAVGFGPGGERPRSAHFVDKDKTFDAILANVADKDQRKGRKR